MEFQRLAEAHHIPFVIAGITHDPLTRNMLEFCGKQGIPAVDISVNLDLPGNRNLPYDIHPSAKANRVYADKLGSFLKERSGPA